MAERAPVEIFSPGSYLKEFLEGRGWTQEDLAAILGRPLQLVNEIALEKRGITPETAKGLGEAFGTSAQLWLNLDSSWQLHKARNSTPDPAIGLRALIYSKGPIKEMVKRGWIEYSSNPEVLKQRILDFYSIKNLDDTPSIMPAAARMATPYHSLNPAQQSWMCRAIHLGKAVHVGSTFDNKNVNDLLVKLRAHMNDPEEIRHVPDVLADAGVRFLVVEHLAKTKIDGACLWLDERSPIIAVSLRYDRIDYFWFTLMHELGHAVRGDGWGNTFLALDEKLVGEQSLTRDEKSDFEIQADEFAEEALIPQEKLNDFIDRTAPLFSERDIRGFASLHHVHPGLVVGQLHHRGTKYPKFRHLLVRMRDEITSSALTDGWGHRVPALV